MTLDGTAHLRELLDIQWPIIQAPMAVAGTPALAAAVSNAGGLGSLAVGATNADGARKMIAAFRALSARSFNVNVFCHQPAKLDGRVESAWIERLRPAFARFDGAGAGSGAARCRSSCLPRPRIPMRHKPLPMLASMR